MLPLCTAVSTVLRDVLVSDWQEGCPLLIGCSVLFAAAEENVDADHPERSARRHSASAGQDLHVSLEFMNRQ